MSTDSDRVVQQTAPLVSIPPDVQQMADQLEQELARLNTPSIVFGLPNKPAAISLWRNLVAYTDGRIIWWNSLRLSHRGRALCSWACTPAGAAAQLHPLYLAARQRWPDNVMEETSARLVEPDP